MKMLLDDIVIGERFRAYSRDTAKAIATSFATEGQITPVAVYKKQLVAGRHRLEAAKLCGWTHIEVRALEYPGLTPEQIEIECSLVEIAENLMRGGLDQADTVRHVEKYAQGSNMRIRLKKEQEAKVAAEAANKARAAALAKVKAEKDAAERARLQSEFEKAEKARQTAAHQKKAAEDRVKELSLAKENNVTSRLAAGVTADLVQLTGMTSSVIRNAHNFVTTLGMETLETIAGTKMATQAEMQGLVGLQKEDPVAAEKCIQSARHAKKHNTGSVHSPSGMLGEIMKARKAAKQEEHFKTLQGQLEECLKHTMAMQHSSEEMRKFWYRLPPELKSKTKNFDQLTPMLNAWASIFRAAAKPVEQKPTGTEHRYADELPTETKDEVRTSLGKNAKKIKAKLAKANKQTAKAV